MSRPGLKIGVLACAVVAVLVVAVALVRGAGSPGTTAGDVPAAPPSGSSAPQQPASPEPTTGAPAEPEPSTGDDPEPTGTTPPAETEDDPSEEPADPAPTAEGTQVPAGTVDEVVDAQPAGPTVEATEDVAELEGGITVRLTRAALQEVEAVGPGETAGTAVVVDLELTNDSADPVGIDSAVVTLTDAEEQLGSPGTGDPYAPFTDAVAPGATAEASYVFRVTDGAQDEPFTLGVTYAPGAPTVTITGTAG